MQHGLGFCFVTVNVAYYCNRTSFQLEAMVLPWYTIVYYGKTNDTMVVYHAKNTMVLPMYTVVTGNCNFADMFYILHHLI